MKREASILLSHHLKIFIEIAKLSHIVQILKNIVIDIAYDEVDEVQYYKTHQTGE